ncbi:hypothetical protein Tco_0623039 [Tanacetum coccineum]
MSGAAPNGYTRPTSESTESDSRRRKRVGADNFSESHMVEQSNNRNVRRRAQTDPSISNALSNESADQIVTPHAAPQCQYYLVSLDYFYQDQEMLYCDYKLLCIRLL